MTTYYEVLNVPPSATQKDIMEAYQKALKTNLSPSQLELLQLAYGTLVDRIAREYYDKQLSYSKPDPDPVNLNSIFEATQVSNAQIQHWIRAGKLSYVKMALQNENTLKTFSSFDLYKIISLHQELVIFALQKEICREKLLSSYLVGEHVAEIWIQYPDTTDFILNDKELCDYFSGIDLDKVLKKSPQIVINKIQNDQTLMKVYVAYQNLLSLEKISEPQLCSLIEAAKLFRNDFSDSSWKRLALLSFPLANWILDNNKIQDDLTVGQASHCLHEILLEHPQLLLKIVCRQDFSLFHLYLAITNYRAPSDLTFLLENEIARRKMTLLSGPQLYEIKQKRPDVYQQLEKMEGNKFATAVLNYEYLYEKFLSQSPEYIEENITRSNLVDILAAIEVSYFEDTFNLDLALIKLIHSYVFADWWLTNNIRLSQSIWGISVAIALRYENLAWKLFQNYSTETFFDESYLNVIAIAKQWPQIFLQLTEIKEFCENIIDEDLVMLINHHQLATDQVLVLMDNSILFEKYQAFQNLRLVADRKKPPEQGLQKNKYFMGLMMLQSRNIVEAIKFFELAVKEGSKNALDELINIAQKYEATDEGQGSSLDDEVSYFSDEDQNENADNSNNADEISSLLRNIGGLNRALQDYIHQNNFNDENESLQEEPENFVSEESGNVFDNNDMQNPYLSEDESYQNESDYIDLEISKFDYDSQNEVSDHFEQEENYMDDEMEAIYSIENENESTYETQSNVETEEDQTVIIARLLELYRLIASIYGDKDSVFFSEDNCRNWFWKYFRLNSSFKNIFDLSLEILNDLYPVYPRVAQEIFTELVSQLSPAEWNDLILKHFDAKIELLKQSSTEEEIVISLEDFEFYQFFSSITNNESISPALFDQIHYSIAHALENKSVDSGYVQKHLSLIQNPSCSVMLDLAHLRMAEEADAQEARKNATVSNCNDVSLDVSNTIDRIKIGLSMGLQIVEKIKHASDKVDIEATRTIKSLTINDKQHPISFSYNLLLQLSAMNAEVWVHEIEIMELLYIHRSFLTEHSLFVDHFAKQTIFCEKYLDMMVSKIDKIYDAEIPDLVEIYSLLDGSFERKLSLKKLQDEQEYLDLLARSSECEKYEQQLIERALKNRKLILLKELEEVHLTILNKVGDQSKFHNLLRNIFVCQTSFIQQINLNSDNFQELSNLMKDHAQVISKYFETLSQYYHEEITDMAVLTLSQQFQLRRVRKGFYKLLESQASFVTETFMQIDPNLMTQFQNFSQAELASVKQYIGLIDAKARVLLKKEAGKLKQAILDKKYTNVAEDVIVKLNELIGSFNFDEKDYFQSFAIIQELSNTVESFFDELYLAISDAELGYNTIVTLNSSIDRCSNTLLQLKVNYEKLDKYPSIQSQLTEIYQREKVNLEEKQIYLKQKSDLLKDHEVCLKEYSDQIDAYIINRNNTYKVKDTLQSLFFSCVGVKTDKEIRVGYLSGLKQKLNNYSYNLSNAAEVKNYVKSNKSQFKSRFFGNNEQSLLPLLNKIEEEVGRSEIIVKQSFDRLGL